LDAVGEFVLSHCCRPEESVIHYSKRLNPDPAQDSNSQQLPPEGGLFIPFYSIQKPPTFLTDLLCIGHPLWFGVRQALRLRSGTVPCCPLGWQMLSQPGKSVAKLWSVKRKVSPTHSNRFMARIRASTGVEFVRCLPPLVVLATDQQVME